MTKMSVTRVENVMTRKFRADSFRLIAAITGLLILADCSGPGNIQILPPGCGNNCPPSPEFLYATSPNHILGFTIDQSTGALSAQSVVTGPNQSTGIAGTFSLGHLYVSDFLNDTADGFSINSSTGALTPITGSPFSLGGTPPGAGGLTPFVADGRFFYATDLNARAVAGFSFDTNSGVLTPVPGSPFAAGNTPVQAAQAGNQGKFLYVSDNGDSAGGILGFTIDPNTGALAPMSGSPFPTGPAGSFPGPSALIANGNFLYVALAGTVNANNQIIVFSIDPNTGSLTPIAGSPFACGNDPLYMAIVPITTSSQAFLYTANIQDNTISAFTVNDTTGALTPISGSPFAGAATLAGIAVSPTAANSGNFFLYAADQSGRILGYAIDGSTGALSPIAGSPFPTGNSPILMTIVRP